MAGEQTGQTKSARPVDVVAIQTDQADATNFGPLHHDYGPCFEGYLEAAQRCISTHIPALLARVEELESILRGYEQALDDQHAMIQKRNNRIEELEKALIEKQELVDARK